MFLFCFNYYFVRCSHPLGRNEGLLSGVPGASVGAFKKRVAASVDFRQSTIFSSVRQPTLTATWAHSTKNNMNQFKYNTFILMKKKNFFQISSWVKKKTGQCHNTSSAILRGFLYSAQGQRAEPLWEMALFIRPLLWGERICVRNEKKKYTVNACSLVRCLVLIREN